MSEFNIIYQDDDLVFCVKPSGINSTDVEGGLPGLVREATHQKDVFTVHRLDQVVSGLMVLTFNKDAARNLSEQQQTNQFKKTYIAVVNGIPEKKKGKYIDYLQRDRSERKTIVVSADTVPSQRAELDYLVVGEHNGKALVKIRLHTGRTHQIRSQFSSRSMPVLGDRKYSELSWDFPIALWSQEIELIHPVTQKHMIITKNPPKSVPWNWFSLEDNDRILLL